MSRRAWVFYVVYLGLLASLGAADKRVVTGARLQAFTAPGSMGRVQNTVYVRCFWPVSELPFEPFAAGSSGIEVEGPPTPRNIIFPAGTVFRNIPGTDASTREVFHKQDLNIPDDPGNPNKRVEISRTEALQIKRTTPLASKAVER